jgi:hypothetical protein
MSSRWHLLSQKGKRPGQPLANVRLQVRIEGIAASEAKNYPEYAPDYWATFFTDPDGTRLEVTNYRQERRERHDNW